MSLPPTYSEHGKLARAVLYTAFNSVTFVVEDEPSEHMYLKVFKRLFGDRISFRRVFPVGGKEKVLDAYQEHRGGKSIVPGPCFFLVDNDLDPYIGIPTIQDDILIYLREYCIENYFVDEPGLVHTLEWKITAKPEDVRSRANFGDWIDTVVNELFPLFVAFAVCRRNRLGENVKLGPWRFFERRGYRVDRSQVEAYITQLEAKYCALGRTKADFQAELSQMEQIIRTETRDNIKAAISGKYLKAGLIRYATNLCNQQLDEDLVLGLLVEYFDIESLHFIRDRVFQTAALTGT